MSTHTKDYIHQLLEKLAQLQLFQEYQTRSNLLENLSGAHLVSRVQTNALQDMHNIFDFAEIIGRTEDGTPALDIVMRNVVRYIPANTQLASDVGELIDRILSLRSSPQTWPKDEIPFVNRQDELNNILSDMAPPYHVIEAPAGYGKTKIMDALRLRFHEKDKNYLCGFASGFNKNSFVNVAADLCSSLGVVQAKFPLPSDLPQDEDELLQKARDMGSAHAGIILGRYFGNVSAPDALSGMAILIDDLDRIINNHNLSHRVLVEQVKKEIRVLVDGYLRGVQEVLSLKLPFKGQNRFRVVISLRYGSEYSELMNYLPFAELSLEPFNYRVVSETVARMLADYERKDLDQISAHLLHLTGGHPACIIEILKRYNNNPGKPEGFEKPEYEKNTWKDVVEPRVGEIKDSIPVDLHPIFLGLSFYRVFNTAILDELIRQKYLDTTCDRHELADRLTLTYLYQRKGHLLSDSITRRLFAIEQRNNMSIAEFKVCCDLASTLCLKQLDNIQRQNADEWALECFYQFLQSCVHNVHNPADRDSMRNKFKNEIIPQIMKAYSQHSSDFDADRSLLVQKIRKDWELLFTINYFLREKEFNNEPVQAFLAIVEKWQTGTA